MSRRIRQRFVIGKRTWSSEIELIRESARNPLAHARCLPKRHSHEQTSAPEKILEIGLKAWLAQRWRLWRTGQSVRHFYGAMTGERTDLGVHRSEDSCFPAEPQFKLRTRSLW